MTNQGCGLRHGQIVVAVIVSGRFARSTAAVKLGHFNVRFRNGGMARRRHRGMRGLARRRRRGGERAAVETVVVTPSAGGSVCPGNLVGIDNGV